VSALALSRNGRLLLSGSQPASLVSDECSIRLWDAGTGKQLRGLEGPSATVTSVALGPEGRWAVCASNDRLLRVYDLEAGPPKPVWTGHNNGASMSGVAITPDGQIISAEWVGRVCVWRRQDGRLDRWEVVGEWELPGPVAALALAGDGKHVATANSNGTVYVLRLPAPAPRKKP
jgi:WD40 repeat protein